MRVVLDTSVVICALFFAGLPGRTLEAWIDERFEQRLYLPIPLGICR